MALLQRHCSGVSHWCVNKQQAKLEAHVNLFL